MPPKPSAAATTRSTSYSVRWNVKSSPSHIAQAARVSPSSGMPAEPGFTSSLSFAPRRRNCRCECPNTSVRPTQRPDAQLVRGLRLAREAVDVAPPAAVHVDDAVDLGALR